MNDAFWRFSGVDGLYDELQPLTPLGKARKERRAVIVDAAELNHQYDLTESAASIVHGDVFDRVSYHLKRIVALPDLADDEPLAASDVYLVKRFLLNYRTIASILPEPVKQAVGLVPAPDVQLGAEADDRETFYIADDASPELRDTRRALREIDDELADLRVAAHERLHERYGLDFRLRDFVVVPSARATECDRADVFVEPYDSGHVIVRPVLSDAYFEQSTAREELAAREMTLEGAILARISGVVRQHASELQACERALTQLDLSLARAVLAERRQLVRPTLRDSVGVSLHGGRLPALEQRCREENLKYWPLDIELDAPVGVVSGSNMCGKTVVLRTLAGCQLAAQLGLFVPADAFATTVFGDMAYIGPNGDDGAEGLSSFALEIVRLRSILHDSQTPTLLVMDEFARSTNSQEAAALISALLEHLGAQQRVRAVLATHYQPLPQAPGVAFYRMKGLREGAPLREQLAQSDGPLAARVRLLHEWVEYAVENDSGAAPARDALDIAAALGLDAEIVALARRYASQ